ncbi:MAG: hypothetical protein GEV05_16005 [Betaproteobacteria bacterium]|nr:hypothetical protein [Betaproteobacteria bacterium]
MLYVVEMDFGGTSRQAEWDAWYLEHLHVLLSLPGFHTAQRFVCLTPWRAPWLAIYTVDSPAVFESVPYRARGGRDSTGEWKPLMRNWDRNVFDGLERAPAVGTEQALLLTDAEPASIGELDVDFCWLEAVGLDRTVTRRGLAVVDAMLGRRLALTPMSPVRAYRPLMAQLDSSAPGSRDSGLQA